MFERETQLSDLRGLFAECRRGKGRMAVVSGPVATGKTELLDQFAEEAVVGGAVFLSASGCRAERAVPFGVLGQLFRSANLSAEASTHVSWLLAEAARSSPVSPVVHHGLCMALLDHVENSDAPLLIGVDDAHNADDESLECLSSVVRRVRSGGVMIVLNEGLFAGERHPLLRAGLPRAPLCRRIRLEPLSRNGVAALLAESLGPARALDLAAACHATTGGNPLLVRALAEDNGGTGPGDELVIGPAFTHTVLSCLDTCEVMRAVARGLAVLAEPCLSLLLGKLADVAPESAVRATLALNECGVLDGGWFRHPMARAAVLDGIPPAEHTELHRRAATLLRTEGSGAASIARQLVQAGAAVEPDLIPVLHEAAEQALAEDDMDHARACLWLARQSGGDERQRATTTAMIARVQWRVDPVAAAAHIGELTEAARAGHLTERYTGMVVQLLSWFGHAERAKALVAPAAGGTTGPHLLALSELVPTGGDRRGAKGLATAERVLQTGRVEEHTLVHTVGALTALMASGRLADAESWCKRLVDEVSGRHMPTWHALLSAIRAEIALRRGELGEAQRHGRLALDLLPTEGWGVVIGLPVGTLVRTHLAAGRVEDASDQLRTPVPDAVFQTAIGLHYMRARGLYYHATGRHRAALDDFQSLGELMAKWGVDSPTLVPWRTDAAQTWLRLGDPDRARQLAEEQGELCEPEDARLRAVSIRIVAATTDPNRRVVMLGTAVEALQGTGDRLELAHTLSDLGWAYHELGNFSQSRLALRSAGLIAKQCDAPAPGRTSQPATSALDLAPADGRSLSDAEARVAMLASWGYSNRQIATKLFITVSTVEQHLTRTYRKLKVNRRSELARGLYSGAVESI
ncbi:AAA family ATPase [Actinosynnema sp. CA-299493]